MNEIYPLFCHIKETFKRYPTIAASHIDEHKRSFDLSGQTYLYYDLPTTTLFIHSNQHHGGKDVLWETIYKCDLLQPDSIPNLLDTIQNLLADEFPFIKALHKNDPTAK